MYRMIMAVKTAEPGDNVHDVPSVLAWSPVIASREDAHKLLDVLFDAHAAQDQEIMNRHLRGKTP